MLQVDGVTFLRKQVVNVFGDENRAMHSARATDGDNELTFSLANVLRDEKINERVEPPEIFLRDGFLFNVSGDFGDGTALVFEFLNVKRIRQKAHVKHHVGVERHTEFEAETQHGNVHDVAVARAEEPLNFLAQFNL